MSAVGALTERRTGNRSGIYEFEIDDKSGTLYLKRQRPQLLGELPFVLMLLVAVTFAMGSYCHYIRLRTSVECCTDRTERLERQYLSLQNDNVILERTLYQTPDLTAVYEAATQELGMVPLTREHLLMYEQNNEEFVYQAENIPLIGYK